MLWGLDGVLIGSLGSTENILSAAVFTACIHDGLAALWIFIVNLRNGKTGQYLDLVRSKGFFRAVLCALLGGAAGMILNIMAVNLAGASYACAVTSAYPAAGAVISIVFFREKCSVYLLSGIVLVISGAVVIGVSPAGTLRGPHFWMGLAAAAAAALCWALEGIFSKSAMKDISSDVLIGIRELISCAAYTIILFLMGTLSGAALPELFCLEKFMVLAAASAAGAFSYLCWYHSMDVMGVMVGMSLNATYAMWAAIFDMIINGKSFSFPAIAGVMIILSGTVLTILHKERKPRVLFRLSD